MKIKSINIAKKKKVEYQGKIIETGIFKKPTEDKVFVNKESIDGDEQADLINHGGLYKAIYAFSSSHYKYWCSVLKRKNLPFGSFGENFTISCLDETSIFIGDRFSIGECVLEVSQPRVPCFKLGIALGNTQAPKLFTKSYNTGVYFKVIKEGSVALDSAINKIHHSTDSVSIHTLFRAYFDKTFENPAKIYGKALNQSALSQEWIEKIKKRLN